MGGVIGGVSGTYRLCREYFKWNPEDIVELYYFEESLRQLFLRYLIKVENEIKSQISYTSHKCDQKVIARYLERIYFNLAHPIIGVVLR
ncbi:MAG: Abi family protein [Lachnospiraceae bacterium]|nr:Abi family protein [Lachnospiraceae bacterium]